MKSILSLVAVCAVVALAGCNSTKSTSTSPGAMGDSKAGCCKESSACCKEGSKVSPGAVGEKSECTKTCPATGQVSPGAVSDSKSGCCKSKTSCTEKAAETVSPGAVSDAKSGCCASKAKASCGSTNN